MDNVLKVLQERGYIEQMTHPQEMDELFGSRKINSFLYWNRSNSRQFTCRAFCFFNGCKYYAKTWSQTYYFSWWWYCFYWRPPEVYRGKGIKYAEEVIRRKEGKTGK